MKTKFVLSQYRTERLVHRARRAVLRAVARLAPLPRELALPREAAAHRGLQNYFAK